VARRPTGVPDQTVREVLEQVAEVFVREGLRGATTLSLADAAGVAESTLLRVTPERKKSSLYVAAYRRAWEVIWLAVSDAAAQRLGESFGDPAATLLADLGVVLGLYDGPARGQVNLAVRPPDSSSLEDADVPYEQRCRWRWRSLLQLVDRKLTQDAADAGVDTAIALLAAALSSWSESLDPGASRFPTVDQTLDAVRGALQLPGGLAGAAAV
jgi:AcrR family transcriptional regulator